MASVVDDIDFAGEAQIEGEMKDLLIGWYFLRMGDDCAAFTALNVENLQIVLLAFIEVDHAPKRQLQIFGYLTVNSSGEVTWVVKHSFLPF